MNDPRPVHTHTVDAPGATITYDVHGDPATSERTPLFVLGSPMDAGGFAALVERVTDRAVIAYDPRGTARSPRTDDRHVNTVAEHADDLRRVIDALGVERLDVFASSGGAVNVLALLESGATRLGTVVAHEPPLSEYVPDRDAQRAAFAKMAELYRAQGFGPAMAMFIQIVMTPGPLPDDFADRPAPDPAAFGLPPAAPPAPDAPDDPLFVLNPETTVHVCDLDALRSTSARLVLGYGLASEQQFPGRAARALADRLGLEPVSFPGAHAGFTPDPHGGDPDAFAARLLEVLG